MEQKMFDVFLTGSEPVTCEVRGKLVHVQYQETPKPFFACSIVLEIMGKSVRFGATAVGSLAKEMSQLEKGETIAVQGCPISKGSYVTIYAKRYRKLDVGELAWE